MRLVFFTDRDLGIGFPATLCQAGLSVERHCDHFPANSPDEDWLSLVGRYGWVALSHDRRIRYKPNELAAVSQHRVRLLIIVGKVPLPLLAQSFVATRNRIEAFLGRHLPPLIAKVHRASPEALKKNSNAPGRIERWYP